MDASSHRMDGAAQCASFYVGEQDSHDEACNLVTVVFSPSKSYFYSEESLRDLLRSCEVLPGARLLGLAVTVSPATISHLKLKIIGILKLMHACQNHRNALPEFLFTSI